MTSKPGRPTVDGDVDRRRAVRALALRRARTSARRRRRAAASAAGCRRAPAGPSTRPQTPSPGSESKPDAPGKRQAPRGCAPRRSRARADARSACSTAAASRSTSRFVEPGGRQHPLQARLALGQRAGLVDDDRRDLLQALERRGVLDQHAFQRAAADADHDRHRRRETERTRTRDDQHGDRHDAARARAAAAARRPPRRRRRRWRSATTAGTNHADTRSTSRWTGARERCACATMCTICDEQRVAADTLGPHHEAAAAVRRSGR